MKMHSSFGRRGRSGNVSVEARGRLVSLPKRCADHPYQCRGDSLGSSEIVSSERNIPRGKYMQVSRLVRDRLFVPTLEILSFDD